MCHVVHILGLLHIQVLFVKWLLKANICFVMLFIHVEQLGSHGLDLHDIYSGFFTEIV